MLQQGTSEWRRLHWIWADMLSRCRNPNHRSFHNYGGRGIAVTPRWRDFVAFAADMGDPRGLMLDRINNDGPYEPSNCRWATRHQQNSNRRNCIYVSDHGESITIREYCRRHALPYRPIMKRIRDRNWPIEAALTIPLGAFRHARRTTRF